MSEELPAPRTPEDWIARAREAYWDFVAALERHGVTVDPELELVAGDSPEAFYEPETVSIRIGMADPGNVSGRLYWAFVARLLNVDQIDEAVEVMGVQLPLIVVHEMTHHLRHRYGAPIQNDFIEEQVVNSVSLAFIAEQPRYRHIVPRLRDLSERASPKLAKLATEAASARAGFRLEAGDVLLERGLLSRSQLERLRHLAEELDVPLSEVLDRADAASDEALADAQEAQRRAEAYFNRRYMLDMSEYQSFHTDWFRTYLAHEEFPSFAQALEQHVLTPDWERTRSEELHRFLVSSLDDPSDEVAVAASEVLADELGPAAVPSALDGLDVRPARRQAALLLGLAGVRDRRLVLAATERLEASDPGLRVAAAAVLGAQGHETERSNGVLHEALGDADHRRGALSVLARVGAQAGLARALTDCVAAEEADVRAMALNVVATLPAGAVRPSSLTLAIADPHDPVRFEAIRCVGRHASPGELTAAIEALTDRAPQVREAARECLAARREEARVALEEATGDLDRRAEAALLLLRLPHDADAEGGARALVDELIRAAEATARSAGTATDGAGSRLLHEALEGRRAALANRALALAGALGDPAQAGLGMTALASADQQARQTGLEIALGAAPPDLAPRLRGLVVSPSRPAVTCSEELVQELRALPAESPPSPADPGAALTAVEKLVFLRAAPLFRTVPLEQLRQLAEEFVLERYDTGACVFDIGGADHCLYVITAGSVRIEQERPGGGRVEIARLAAGQTFGETGLLIDEPRDAAAFAAASTALLRMDRESFVTLGRRHPDLLLETMRTLGRLLREADRDLG